MLRHCVPHAALLKFGKANLQLAASAAGLLGKHLLDDQLVDAAGVGLLEGASLDIVADGIKFVKYENEVLLKRK